MRVLTCLLLVGSLLASASYATDVDLGGLVQVRYTDLRGKDAEFTMNAARLKASVDATDRIKVMVKIGAACEPNLLEAYMDYFHSELVGLRVGQFKLPFGLESQLTPYDLEATRRAQVFSCLWNNGVCPCYVRDIGLVVMGRHKILDYKLGVVNGAGYNFSWDPETAGTQLFPKWARDNNNSKDVVGRVGLGIPMFAGLGFSVYEGRWPIDRGSPRNHDRTAKGFDLFLDTGKILLQYEHIWAQGRVNDDALDFKTDKYGGYFVVLGYRVNPLIEPVWKVDICDPNKDADGDRMTDLYFGVNLNFQRSARVQLFYRESKLAKRFAGSAFLAQVSAKL